MHLSPNFCQSKRVVHAALLGTALTLLALAPAAAEGRYHDGEFTGQPAETQWGDVQVKAVIRNGSVVDVQFLQYPYHRRRSAEISGYALPALRTEVLSAQSARVNMISGATMTAEGFQETVASALAQAARGGGV
jgi:uncharacterized protein with FMN-binding domain